MGALSEGAPALPRPSTLDAPLAPASLAAVSHDPCRRVDLLSLLLVPRPRLRPRFRPLHLFVFFYLIARAPVAAEPARLEPV